MLLRLPPARHRHRLNRAAWRLVLGLAVCLAAAPCRPQADPAPEIALDWTVVPDPPAVGPVRFSLTLAETMTGRPVAGARVRLEGNMSHPGMQPVFAAAREVAPGRYEAPLGLSMAGDWFVLVEAALPDGRTFTRQVDLPGVLAR